MRTEELKNEMVEGRKTNEGWLSTIHYFEIIK